MKPQREGEAVPSRVFDNGVCKYLTIIGLFGLIGPVGLTRQAVAIPESEISGMTTSNSKTEAQGPQIPMPISEERLDVAIAGMRRGHPRVVVTPERAAALRAAGPASYAGQLADAAMQRAEKILELPPVGYEKEGRRLLGVSREALRRLTLLGVAWMRGGDARFVRRAEAELQAVCAFPDWNPSHYLDTAEMALAVAFAYDWMYAELTPEARATARDGLVRHAFGTAFPPAGYPWPEARNNWGQVCQAGLSAAALALLDEEPETARRILLRAVNNVQIAATCYAPDGDYPEGPIYWDYGTSFHVVLIDALRSALGTDFALDAMPGFRTSANSVLHMTGPTGHLYGFADGASSRRCFATMLWFAAEGATSLPADAPERKLVMRDRLDPLAVFWADRLSVPSGTPAQPLDHLGRGSQPVLAMRSGWGDPAAWYLGVKGGSPSGPHGHMDGGSFVLEARGERWVLDLGADSYHRIESRGMNLWSPLQDSDRWRVFRLGTAAHSVIRIDDGQQRVQGVARPLECVTNDPDPFTRWDLSSLYPAATRVERRFDFPGRAAVRVTDTVEGLAAGSRVTWSFATKAEVVPDHDDPRVMALRQNGQVLRVTATGGTAAAWRVVAADTLLQPHDSPLPGVWIVSFEDLAPASGVLEMGVCFE
jgi:hypothetical protein